jgi:hypothetical protein
VEFVDLSYSAVYQIKTAIVLKWQMVLASVRKISIVIYMVIVLPVRRQLPYVWSVHVVGNQYVLHYHWARHANLHRQAVPQTSLQRHFSSNRIRKQQPILRLLFFDFIIILEIFY